MSLAKKLLALFAMFLATNAQPRCAATQYLSAGRCSALTECIGANIEVIPPTATSDRVCLYQKPSLRAFLLYHGPLSPLQASEFCANNSAVLAHPRNSDEMVLLSNARLSPEIGLYVGLQRDPTKPANCSSPFYWTDTGAVESTNCSAGGVWCPGHPTEGTYLAAFWDPMQDGKRPCLKSFARSWSSTNSQFPVACQRNFCPYNSTHATYFDSVSGACLPIRSQCPAGEMLMEGDVIFSDHWCIAAGHNPDNFPFLCQYESDIPCHNCTSYEYGASVYSILRPGLVFACLPLHNCTPGLQYESVPPTRTSNRQCSDISLMCRGDRGEEMFEAQAPTPTSDRECQYTNICLDPFIEIRPPTPYSDRVCDFCPNGQVKVSSKSCRSCPPGTYVENGVDFLDATSNCDDYVCPAGTTDHDFNSATPCFTCAPSLQAAPSLATPPAPALLPPVPLASPLAHLPPPLPSVCPALMVPFLSATSLRVERGPTVPPLKS
eukprot:m.115947 g.115947  ORF g.115947 m.115947 type:complete len:492 (-) comp14456_c1_seq4:3616-5091(-)